MPYAKPGQLVKSHKCDGYGIVLKVNRNVVKVRWWNGNIVEGQASDFYIERSYWQWKLCGWLALAFALAFGLSLLIKTAW